MPACCCCQWLHYGILREREREGERLDSVCGGWGGGCACTYVLNSLSFSISATLCLTFNSVFVSLSLSLLILMMVFYHSIHSCVRCIISCMLNLCRSKAIRLACPTNVPLLIVVFSAGAVGVVLVS